MTFTVLSDNQVNAILENLTLDELDEFRNELASALHEFSNNTEDTFQQPHRISTLHYETQATTLYMPSCSPAGMGCKGTDSPTPMAIHEPRLTLLQSYPSQRQRQRRTPMSGPSVPLA